MCRPRLVTATVALPPAAASVRDGRRFVTGILDTWGMPELCETAALLTSELLTNSILYARTDIVLTLSRHESGVEIVVRDGSRAASPAPSARCHYRPWSGAARAPGPQLGGLARRRRQERPVRRGRADRPAGRLRERRLGGHRLPRRARLGGCARLLHRLRSGLLADPDERRHDQRRRE